MHSTSPQAHPQDQQQHHHDTVREADALHALTELFPHLKLAALVALRELFPAGPLRHP